MDLWKYYGGQFLFHTTMFIFLRVDCSNSVNNLSRLRPKLLAKAFQNEPLKIVLNLFFESFKLRSELRDFIDWKSMESFSKPLQKSSRAQWTQGVWRILASCKEHTF